MKLEDVKKIAIIGSGAMGHGIAQVCAVAGINVVIKDIKQEFLDNAVSKVKESLTFLVGKGKIPQKTLDNVMNNLLTTTLDTKTAVADAQIVIEAVPEILDLKKSVFKEISGLAAKDTILATNTSTMSISEIGAVVDRPERFVGMHFFNPVNRMKLVEVIYGNKTTDETADLLVAVTEKINKKPIKVLKDSPGFIVNRINAPNQALFSAILDEGKEKPCEIDAGMKETGMPMGPFELADYVGLDVFCHTLSYYSKTLSKDYTPGKLLSEKLKNNELGMKTGKGIYDWSAGKAVIDLSKKSTTITPMELLAVQLNEAVKVYKEEVSTSTNDIDNSLVFGMNAFMGPFGLCAGQDPKILTDTLNKLSERFNLEIFKPEPEIIDGSYKNFNK
ncbi:MAG: 3-hydroxyacyl-CoA dehydrogenase family protein [Proteobacteria bacterium]|nr:3-hydroxyacyl-CoA dehydrogenase family protein [Pseudomonadota bacterium]